MPEFQYLGGSVMLYQSYINSSTGKMLVAEPGCSYSMTPVDGGPGGDGWPVPPNDGRWAALAPAPAVVIPQPAPAAPAPAPAPSAPAPQGGDN